MKRQILICVPINAHNLSALLNDAHDAIKHFAVKNEMVIQSKTHRKQNETITRRSKMATTSGKRKVVDDEERAIANASFTIDEEMALHAAFKKEKAAAPRQQVEAIGSPFATFIVDASPCSHRLFLYQAVAGLCWCGSDVRNFRIIDKDERANGSKAVLSLFPASQEFFEACLRIVKSSRHPEVVTAALKENWQCMQALLSREHAEILLAESEKHHDAENRYKVVNQIVRMCNEPWAIDVQLGSSGVCYFGNMGTPPRYNGIASMIRTNRRPHWCD